MKTHFKPGERVGVLVDVPLGTLLDYHAPEGGLTVGSFVLVPLRNRDVVGVVWSEGRGDVADCKLRSIRKELDVPALDAPYMKFMEKMSEYTITPLSSAFFRLTLVPDPNARVLTTKLCQMVGKPPTRMTPSRERILRFLRPGEKVEMSELMAKARVSPQVIHRLSTQGFLKIAKERTVENPLGIQLKAEGVTLNSEQREAVGELFSQLNRKEYSTVLLKGVPGAGKTEVYLEAIARMLEDGRQVLVMLPEIALTTQVLNRFEERFKVRPLEWHSAVSKAKKRKIWRMAAEGKARLVVGARSALFLPLTNLGLIVVDEEHDSSFKQDSGVIYHARDMAVLRASLCRATVILVSATPSLESLTNVTKGKYTRIDLRSRYGDSVLPEIGTIDMRGEKKIRGRWISSALIKEVSETLERGEQALLFLNRRGYAPTTTCSECGYQVCCADCDTTLVEHRFRQEMICHLCGARSPMPEECQKCHARDSFVPVGPGVERLAEEVSNLFKDYRLEVLSSDLITSTAQLMDTLDRITRGDVDIIIGTQIIAKGHNFPKLTLVGVVDADVGLHGGDFRAAERTFQIVRQVCGRAGRADLPGVALLQTWQPDNPVIQAIVAQDDEQFLVAESCEREVAGCPPFGQYVAIVVSGKNPEEVEGYVSELYGVSSYLDDNGITVYGPAPAPIFRIQGRVRYRLLLKAEKSLNVQRTIRQWLSMIELPKRVRLNVDVDPIWFM